MYDRFTVHHDTRGVLTWLPQSTANNSGYNINAYECGAPSATTKQLLQTTHNLSFCCSLETKRPNKWQKWVTLRRLSLFWCNKVIFRCFSLSRQLGKDLMLEYLSIHEAQLAWTKQTYCSFSHSLVHTGTQRAAVKKLHLKKKTKKHIFTQQS